jgi:hypothetical protein
MLAFFKNTVKEIGVSSEAGATFCHPAGMFNLACVSKVTEEARATATSAATSRA